MSPDWRRRRRRRKKKWSSYCSYIKFPEKSLIDCSIICSLLRSVTVAKRWYTLITYAWSYPHSVAKTRIYCHCLFLNISFLPLDLTENFMFHIIILCTDMDTMNRRPPKKPHDVGKMLSNENGPLLSGMVESYVWNTETTGVHSCFKWVY